MKVLFVGESWTILQTNVMGYDSISISHYNESKAPFLEMLISNGFDVDYMPSHIAHLSFPDNIETLKNYSAVIFSDIGSNTFLLHPDMQQHCNRKVNRLKVIREYVSEGGGFLMIGGYMSYSGFGGKARYGMTPIADILPVDILNYDDREEHPDGIVPQVTDMNHPILRGVDESWPDFLGYNKLTVKKEAQLIVKMANNDAFISAMNYKKGRTVAFASDCVPHWGTPEFISWKHYKTLFGNIIKWISNEI